MRRETLSVFVLTQLLPVLKLFISTVCVCVHCRLDYIFCRSYLLCARFVCLPTVVKYLFILNILDQHDRETPRE